MIGFGGFSLGVLYGPAMAGRRSNCKMYRAHKQIVLRGCVYSFGFIFPKTNKKRNMTKTAAMIIKQAAGSIDF